MRKHGIRHWFNGHSILWIGMLLCCLDLAQADTIHFNSGTITATVSGYEEIGNTMYSLSGHAGSLAAWGTVDGSCGFCGSFIFIPQNTVSTLLHLGIQSATFNGNQAILWGGIVISGNPFLLPETAIGSFIAIRPVSISGWFVSPDGTYYTLAKHGRIRIKFFVSDGIWSWDSAEIRLVPEPATLLLFGTGLLCLGLRQRFIQKFL